MMFSYEDDYRFGFNGGEKDNEIKGKGNSLDLGLRMYDTRLGRMMKVDPRTAEYPWQTPYAYHRNSPIWKIDFLGGGDGDKNKSTFWSSFFATSASNIGSVISYANNNPNHAGYGYSPQMKPITQEQIKQYSISWSDLHPLAVINRTGESAVGGVQGLYNFGLGIYNQNGAQVANSMGSVFSATLLFASPMKFKLPKMPKVEFGLGKPKYMTLYRNMGSEEFASFESAGGKFTANPSGTPLYLWNDIDGLSSWNKSGFANDGPNVEIKVNRKKFKALKPESSSEPAFHSNPVYYVIPKEKLKEFNSSVKKVNKK